MPQSSMLGVLTRRILERFERRGTSRRNAGYFWPELVFVNRCTSLAYVGRLVLESSIKVTGPPPHASRDQKDCAKSKPGNSRKRTNEYSLICAAGRPCTYMKTMIAREMPSTRLLPMYKIIYVTIREREETRVSTRRSQSQNISDLRYKSNP